MPTGDGTSQADTPVSRRRLNSLIIGGALTGAVWTTGLTVLARGRHPQVFALGTDGWQVLLLEHGSNRIVILAGMFDRSPELEIDLLCGLLRQHIDVVIGDRDVLGRLSPGFRERRAVTTIIDISASSPDTGSRHYVPLSRALILRAGIVQVEIAPLAQGLWNDAGSVGSGWIGQLTIEGLVIAVSGTLDAIADHGMVRAALAIAPMGNMDRLWRTMPGITIATNSRDSLETYDVPVPDGGTIKLVRTFRRDIARFRIRNEQIELPKWTQEFDGVSRS